MDGNWVRRGHFDFSGAPRDGSPSQRIRDVLSAHLKPRSGRLGIASFPVGQTFRHTFWWREGDRNYAEAQFFMSISREHQVLSAGVSVEKGYGDPRDGQDRMMDRQTWHWPVFAQATEDIVGDLVPRIHRDVRAPISIRLRVAREDSLALSLSRCFTFYEDEWFERRVGRASDEDIVAAVRHVDGLDDHWTDAYVCVDLAPKEVDAMDEANLGALLLQFEPLWRRLRT